MSERHLVGEDRDQVPMCMAFVRSVVVYVVPAFRYIYFFCLMLSEAKLGFVLLLFSLPLLLLLMFMLMMYFGKVEFIKCVC